MTVSVSFLLTILGLQGIYSITTVSKVSVKVGSSITVPCHYDSRYINHVKYLCKGYRWANCQYAVKTNEPQVSERFSISDNKPQSIFTVTLRSDGDEYYWCAVEINQGSDERKFFQLSIIEGPPSLYVDQQEITGFNGDNITISCYNSISGQMKWCRLGGSCVTELSGSIDKTTVTINATAPSVFTVTMTEVTTESSGWYLCVKGDFQMPVHLTVSEKTDTYIVLSKPTERPAVESKVYLRRFLIPLGLLIFFVMVALIIWLNLKKNKQSNMKSSSIIVAKEEVTYSEVKHRRKTDQACKDKVYRNVGYVRESVNQKMPNTEIDVDIIYSSVVTIKPQTVKTVNKNIKMNPCQIMSE